MIIVILAFISTNCNFNYGFICEVKTCKLSTFYSYFGNSKITFWFFKTAYNYISYNQILLNWQFTYIFDSANTEYKRY